MPEQFYDMFLSSKGGFFLPVFLSRASGQQGEAWGSPSVQRLIYPVWQVAALARLSGTPSMKSSSDDYGSSI